MDTNNKTKSVAEHSLRGVLFLLLAAVILLGQPGLIAQASQASTTAADAANGTTVGGAADAGQPRVLPGMDAPPPADQAVVADKRNPAWVTRYGTQAGLQFLAPRQATFEVSPQGPDVGLGAWQTFNLSQAHTVNAIQAVPDGRVFAAVASSGLRVYAPTGDGSYTWSEIHASVGGLASDNVNSLAYLAGYLWVGTNDAGISILNLFGNSWVTYDTGNSGLPTNTIQRMTPVSEYLPDNVVYISTFSGVERYHFDGFDVYWTRILDGTPVYDVAAQFMYGFELDWFATNGGVVYYDGANWITYSSGNTGVCNMWRAHRIVVDPYNTVWFAAEVFVPARGGNSATPQAPQDASGLCTYNNGTWTAYRAITPGLPGDTVTDLAVDGAGRVWISMYGGAAAYDQGTWLMISTGRGFPIYADNVTSVAAVGEAVWFGMYGTTAFSQYSPNWQRYTNGDMGGSGGNPHAVLIESAQTWVGLGTELSNYGNARWDTNAIPGNTADVSALARDGTGTLWIGTAGNGLYTYDGLNFTHQTTADGLPGDAVRALVVDHAGRLWVGTDGGLALRGNGYWLGFTTANSALTSNDIRALTSDAIDRIWIGTGDQGINILAANTLGGTAWSTQTTADGLPSNIVNALATDPVGAVWAATSVGLASWDPGTSAWSLQLPAQALSVASDPQGRIWAGTTSALYELEGSGWKSFYVTGTMLGGDHVIALASDGDRLWALGNGIVAVRGVLTGPIGFYTPVISSFSPMQGSLADTITINGDHFDDRDNSLNEVLFGDAFNPAMRAQVMAVSQTQLLVKVPKLAITGLIYVRAHGLTGVSADTFTVLPRIGSISPSCLGIGSVLYVWGAGFTSDNNNQLYIRLGSGPWRYADVSDPSLVRQILRPGDTSGAVQLRMGLNGPVITSNQTIGLSQPQVVGQPAIQQGIQGEQMVWGKRTLVALSLQSTGATCNAQINSGYIEWKLKDGTSYKDSNAFFPSNTALQVGTTPTGTRLDKTASFVLGVQGYSWLLPAFSDFNGVRIHLTNGPVELLTYDIPASSFNFINTGSRHHFLNIAVLPSSGFTNDMYKTYLANAQKGLLNVARAFPQQDLSPINSSDSWMDWGYMTLFWDHMVTLKDGSDFGDLRSAVDNYRELINDNGTPFLDQGMAIVDANLYTKDTPGGKAQVSCYDPFSDCDRYSSVSFNGTDYLAGTYLQEAIHVTGWVDSGSPNYANYNDYHSKYDEGQWADISQCKTGQTFNQALLDQTGSAKRVMTLLPQSGPYEFSLAGCDNNYQPRSAMSYVPTHYDTSMFLEPLDYRHTLSYILNNDSSDAGPLAMAAYTQTLRLSGDIDATDGITVSMSYLMGNSGQLTAPSSVGSYELDLRDAGDALLSSQHFSMPIGDTHGQPETLYHFSLHVPFLTGTHKAEILHNGTLIWSATVSANAPTVSFTAPSGGSYNAASPIHITWNASDPDSDPLQFALAYSADNGATWVQVAAALTGSSYDWTPGFIPAGSQARLRLTASDGFNTSQAVSDAFTLTARSPFAFILSPENGATFTEGALASLVGGSMTSDGTDQGDFLWSYDNLAVPLGFTKDLTTTLNEVGVHTLTVQVTTSNGMSDSSSITVTVKGDYDHDGMPNDWELAHKLNPLDPTDAFTDADGDGLSNLREYQLGTDPRNTDTDGDSAGDGAEVTAGTDPLRADQTPPTGPVLSVGADTLGWTYRQGSPAPSAWHIWVTNGGAGSLSWSASDDAAWLSVTPGSGSAPTELVISANPAGLANGEYTAHITVSSGGASGSPHDITVTLKVYEGSAYQSLYLPIAMKP
jgi:ligand-binding sensor domain-containing protein